MIRNTRFILLRKTGLLSGEPTGSYLNRRDELDSGWTGYKMILEGILERFASKPPGFVEVVVWGRFLRLERLASTPPDLLRL